MGREGDLSMRRVGALSFCLAALAALGAAHSAAAAAKPVPSLTPAATAKLWTRLVHRKRVPLAATGCRTTRVIVYTQTDWLRAATKLAANASPCAQYSISIPSIAGDKTAARGDQAWRIRALGPQFHALDEINFTGWSSWVGSTGATWLDAGAEARRRLAAAGFNTSLGDTWAVNEFSSAVRKGTGAARQNVRDFVRGLAGADGVKGVVFQQGIAQTTSDLSVYKANLQSWLQDAAFWTDMSAYVADFGQETYGDVRAYAVPGSSAQTRRDYLAQFLGHGLALADAGPESVAAAHAFLQSSYFALGNAAWAWDAAYGWTNVTFDRMQGFVSTQVYAQRASGDRVGFVWAPKNLNALPPGDYTSQGAAILDRLAAAIRDASEASADPGAGACGPSGQNLYCTGDVDGAAFTGAWQTFSTWSQPAVGFATAPAALTAGTPSAALSVQLQIAGAPETAAAPVTVTLASSSARGSFAPAPNGPWTSTLSLTIPAGAGSAGFYYADTVAATPTLTATAPGRTAATQAETVAAGPLASLALSPASASVAAAGTATFTAAGADAYGNPVAVSPAWSVPAGTPGTVSATGVFSATAPGSGTVVAAAGSVSGAATVTVTQRP
jgi:hypothetical protein